MVKELEVQKYGLVRYNLAAIAKEKGLSLRKIAQMADLNSPLILYRCTSGKTQPSFWQIARICAVLNVSIPELMEYVPPEKILTPDNAGALADSGDGLPDASIPDTGNPNPIPVQPLDLPF